MAAAPGELFCVMAHTKQEPWKDIHIYSVILFVYDYIYYV